MSRSEFGATSALQVAEDIIPIGELKARLSEKIRELKGRQRPFVVTQSGKAVAVLLAPEEFDRLTAQGRFVVGGQEGLDDLEEGRVVSHDELGRRLDARFGALAKSKK